MVWLVLIVGVVSAYRHRTRVWLSQTGLEASQRFVLKYGAWAVFVARFLPGLRLAAGPVAGISGMPALGFFIVNALGARLHVRVMRARSLRRTPRAGP